MSELFEQNVKDAYFDFNKADIRPDARDALAKTAEFLRSYPQVRVTIEGHCDERGSTEYNIGLGERRAQAAKNYLTSLGITRQSDGHRQLGQGAALLHRAHRRVLATESPRATS